ncbi:MAG TPA: prepilin-type N-terminal cleavage/methylation domain-containing protein [Candidatus Omnitrophica bacterium]|nr:prepilin-type N-terminal cleavage/methylation domain-containing protein [Candidatus Omnitrophota bacterium]
MRGKKAFTAMELLIVVVIVALLAVLVFPIFRKTVEKSREKLAITNLKMILAGENLYKVSYDHYFPRDKGETLDAIEDINQALGLDIEERFFDYKIEKDPQDPYKFNIVAYEKGTTNKIYSIDQAGKITYYK